MNLPYSIYAINSLKHQFIVNFRSQFIKNFSQRILYKYTVRSAGDEYGVMDIALKYHQKKFVVSLKANNIFNEEYTGTNLVPMPKGNSFLGVKYRFDL